MTDHDENEFYEDPHYENLDADKEEMPSVLLLFIYDTIHIAVVCLMILIIWESFR